MGGAGSGVEEWRRGWGLGGGTRGLVARESVPAGACSEPFTAGDLLRALERGQGSPALLHCEGGVLSGGAALAASLRLAPDHVSCDAALIAAGPLLAVLVLRPVPAGSEPLLWPDPALARHARLPCLLPTNITEGPRYVCRTCGAVFPWPHPLKVHLMLRCAAPAREALLRRLAGAVDTDSTAPPAPCGTEPHRCTVCGKRYSRRYGLKIHLRTHSGLKPLRCPHCARAFADPSNLNKHRRLHQRPLTPAGPTSLALDRRPGAARAS